MGCLELQVFNVFGDIDYYTGPSIAMILYTGTGADTRSSDGGRPLAVRNPVYDTIDTQPSITAGMAESLDGDPPGYYTVEMVLYIHISAYSVCIDYTVTHFRCWCPW